MEFIFLGSNWLMPLFFFMVLGDFIKPNSQAKWCGLDLLSLDLVRLNDAWLSQLVVCIS